MLQSMKRMVERNRIGLKLAERDYYPDFDFKLAYGQRDDGPLGRRADMVTAMVAINLPLWYKTKQERKVAESQKDIQAAKDQLTAMTNEIRFMIERKIDRDRKGREANRTFEDGDHSPRPLFP